MSAVCKHGRELLTYYFVVNFTVDTVPEAEKVLYTFCTDEGSNALCDLVSQ